MHLNLIFTCTGSAADPGSMRKPCTDIGLRQTTTTERTTTQELRQKQKADIFNEGLGKRFSFADRFDTPETQS